MTPEQVKAWADQIELLAQIAADLNERLDRLIETMTEVEARDA